MIVWSALAAAAFAQELPEMNTNLWRMPVDSGATLWADDTHTTELGLPTARVVFGWLNGPLGVTSMADGEQRTLVGDVVGFNLIGGVGFGRARVGLDLPIYALVTSDLDEVGGAGFGDLALDVKVRINEPAETGLGVAGAVRATLPTGDADGLSSGATGELSGIVDYTLEDGTVFAGNLAYRVAPKVDLTNLQTNDDLRFRVGVGHPLNESLGVSADLASAVFLGASGANGPPLEALLGGWGRIDDAWVVRGGAGMGLTNAVGSPNARLVLALGYEPRAPKVDPDPDLDGILGDLDKCPTVAEDKDGWQDEDGCADDKTEVHVSVLDAQGRHIGLAEAHFASEAADFDTRDGSTLEVPPGSYELFAKANGFVANAATFAVPDGPPVEASVTLQAEAKLASVTLTVKDAAGAPVEATWSLNASAPARLAHGTATSSIAPGAYKVVVSAPGYVSQEFAFDAKPDGQVLIEKVLLRETGKVKIRVVDPAGAPVAAEWKSEGQVGALPGGLGELVLPLGKRTIAATADGFRPGSVDVEVVAGDVPVEITLTMDPAKVLVTVDRIDIKGAVYFDSGKDTIKPESFPLLDEVSQILLDHPELLLVSIEGHTDSRGSDTSNLTLSDKRAKSVRAYMIARGVAADRLTSKGYGESKPLVAEENEAAWSQNRRVEFLIVKRAD